MPASETALAAIEHLRQDLEDMALKIWELAEPGLQEHRSSALQADALEGKGFTITRGVAGMPTAFVAEFRSHASSSGQTGSSGRDEADRGDGTGGLADRSEGPVIGILGEYDALPRLSQKVQPTRESLQEGAPGHGCGHNLLGTAGVGAAMALKDALVRHNLPGTIRYYGCPAEETLVGKVFMVRDGLFDDVDAALTWHPGQVNSLWASSSNAMNSARFIFKGRTSHAAADPASGRSALDAVELMNVAANYMREHISTEARLHYVITDGGGEPNVVPDRAEVWYYVRAPRRDEVDEIYAWLLDIARGAALMTQTSHEVELLSACYNVLPNDTIGGLMLKNLRETGGPRFNDQERAFAARIAESFPPGTRERGARRYKNPDLADTDLVEGVIDPVDRGQVMAGSTDVGDVSWVTPTAQFTTVCAAFGSPGHSWQNTAAGGMSIGLKGMVAAAQVLALTALDLMADPTALAAAREEFQQAVGDTPYRSPLTEGAQPPFHQLGH